MSGNVFLFSFSREGWESIVNLTEIHQQQTLCKITGEERGHTVDSIISMMEIRARFNENRGMEVWMVKLDEEFTEQGLIEWADKDPQAVADLARMGTAIYCRREIERDVIK